MRKKIGKFIKEKGRRILMRATAKTRAKNQAIYERLIKKGHSSRKAQRITMGVGMLRGSMKAARVIGGATAGYVGYRVGRAIAKRKNKKRLKK